MFPPAIEVGLWLVSVAAVGLIVYAVCRMVYEALDQHRGSDEWLDGVVREKHYTPPVDSVGVGTVLGGQDAGELVVTQNHSDAQWTLFIAVKGFEEDEEFSAGPRLYKTLRPGQHVRLLYRRGGISGTLYGPEGLRHWKA